MSAIPEEAGVAAELPTEEGVASTSQPEEPAKLPEFDQRYKEKFTGLMYLGALVKEFEWMGHKFVIRTLKTDELLAIGVLMKEWVGTSTEIKAYATAVVAMTLVSIDDQPLPTPVQVEKDAYAWAFQRFNWTKATLYPYTIDRLHDECLLLESEAAQVFEAMGKAFGSMAA